MIIGTMLFGCATDNNLDTSGEISFISVEPKFEVTNSVSILEVKSFISDHSDGWKKSWNTPIHPEEYIYIQLMNGNSYCLGYRSKWLIKYSGKYYREQQVDKIEIDRLKNLIDKNRIAPTSGLSLR